MELFFLFEVGVELSETFKCQLFGQLDELWVGHVLLLEFADFGGVSSTEHQDLLVCH